MNFDLQEGDPLASIIKLDVEIDPENHPQAEATAAHGLDEDQRSAASVAAAIAKERAATTLAPAHNVLDVFLHELNIYSSAPMAIFDAARIWPSDSGTQYGVGGGLRFSLVNVNFSASYVFNVHPVASQGAGALFFQLDVTNVVP